MTVFAIVKIKDKEDTLKLQRVIDRLGNWANLGKLSIPGGPQGAVLLNILLQDSLRYSVS